MSTTSLWPYLFRNSHRFACLIVVGCLALVVPSRAERETAASADGFVDSIGICTHITTVTGPYSAAHIANVYSALGELGVRHIRADVHSGSLYPSRCDYLYTTYGIRSTMIANRNLELSLATQAQIFLTHDSIEAMEGLNEPDNIATYNYTNLQGVVHTDTTSANIFDATRALQIDLDSYLTGGTKPLLSPAMTSPMRAQFLNPLAVDAIAIHCYPWGRIPSGFGFSNSAIQEARKLGENLPIIATESGYHTATLCTSPNPYVTEAAQGKYIPRLLAEYFSRGITRTYTYELMDSGDDANGTDLTDKEQNFGLVRYDFSRKPAFDAEKNLINLLKESTWDLTNQRWVGGSATFAPGILDYTLTGAPNTVHRLLLQKSDGTFYLILWQEIPVCNINVTPHSDIINPTVPVVLTLNTAIRKAEIYQPNLSSTASSVIFTPRTITLDVPDQLLVVKLTPATYPKPWLSADLGTVPVLGSTQTVGGTRNGFRGDYYDNQDFTNWKLSRLDNVINFNWTPTTPDPLIAPYSFTVRWTGRITPQYSETYTFTTTNDDGSRLWINGTQLINDWTSHAALERTCSIALTAGQTYDIKHEYFQGTGSAAAKLEWSSPSTPRAAIPVANAWLISGSGSDLGGTVDAGQYAYQPFNGDGEFIARVVNMPGAAAGSKAGIMIRQNLTSNCPYVAALVTPSKGVNFQYRAATGSNSGGTSLAGVTSPCWLKLARQSNTFSAYTSTDGLSWTLLGTPQSIAMGTNLYVGMAVCSRLSTASAATFDSVSLTFPTVSIQATTPQASESPLTAGAFTVTRTGATSSALTVSYTVAGNATNGADYATLSGTVMIPAGSTTASIAVTPINDTNLEGDETVQLSLAGTSTYNVGTPACDTVKITSEEVIDDFESGSLSNWTLQNNSRSAISVETINVDTGSKALKWVYTDDGVNLYTNVLSRNFATAQNWTNAGKLVLRLAESSANPMSDLGNNLFFDLYNNGVKVTGGWAVDTITLDGTTAYRTVEFDLSNFPRDQVTSIVFYVLGNRLSTGPHIWYIDNIALSAVTFTNTSTVTAPTPTAAVSRRGHGTGGNFDIPISVVSGTAGVTSPPVECRSGTSETLVVTFNKAIQSARASIASGTATVSAMPVINGSTATVTLTGVGNAQTVKVNLFNITATDGGFLPNAVVSLRVLAGDVNADGAVSTTDVSALQASFGATAGQAAFNCRADLDQDGTVASPDITVIQSNYGTQAP